MNGTQVLGSLAFQVGIMSGDVAHGAVICLFLFPFLLLAVIPLVAPTFFAKVIAARYTKGETITALALDYDCGDATIWRVLHGA